MIPLTRLTGAVALALLSAMGMNAAAARLPEGPEVLVVSDVLAEKPETARPTPQHPIYYVIMGGMERSLGDSVAGEPMPDRASLERELERVLAGQGFIRTKVGGPKPEIALVLSWGSANLIVHESTETDSATGESSTTYTSLNQREIAQLVGANKANRHLLMSSDAERINDAAREDRLYLFVAALDVDALAKKKKQLVWRTRISIESRRHSLPDSIKIMLASAAPYFGRESDLPVFIEDTDRRKADVQIGVPTVTGQDVPLPPARPSGPAPKQP